MNCLDMAVVISEYYAIWVYCECCETSP